MTTTNDADPQKQFFNQHAAGWLDRHYLNPDTGRYDLHEAGFERLLPLLRISPGATVLDVGCGTGVLVPYLLAAMGRDGILYEMDYAEAMIAENRRRHTDSRIRFLVEDIADLSLPESSCDVVVCFACFPHFHDKAKALRLMQRVLRSGGHLSVAHFMSSDELRQHHRRHSAVARDGLPGRKAMQSLVTGAGLEVTQLVDESGFYFMGARKPV